MKKITIVLALIGMALVVKSQNFTIQVDTLREYRLYLPKNYNLSNTYPLLFAFHGGFGLNWQFEKETGFSDLADTANIIVVYPQAIGTTRSWNTGVCCGWAYNNKISDLDFVAALVKHLTATYNVDTTKIFATGFSSGAMMTYAVGCKFSKVFAAIAPVSSSMLIDSCNPECTPVPTIHLHAQPDSSAPFYGGFSSNPLLQFYYPPVDSVMTNWSIKNNCSAKIDTTLLANGTTIYRWNYCQDDTYQEIWLADDGGHKWPGTPGKGVLSGDSATQDFYATSIIWQFLKQFSKDCTTKVGLAKSTHLSERVSLYPNPTSRTLYILTDGNDHELEVTVYSPLGEEILRTKTRKAIDISSLPTGQYFLRIVGKEASVVAQILKI